MKKSQFGLKVPKKNWLYEGYKEPIRPVENGNGYYGVVIKTKDKEFVMSHEDGLFYKALNTQHAKKFGYKNLREYKEHFGISQNTALCGVSESKRNHDKAMKYFAKIGASKLKEVRSKAYQVKGRKGRTISLEVRNKRGTCPDQLLDKIVKLKQKLGYTPSLHDFNLEYNNKFSGAIENYFGSYLNGVRSAKLLPNSVECPRGYTTEYLLDMIRTFFETHSYTPLSKDFGTDVLPTKQAYYRHWRTLNAARLNAGVPLVMSFRRAPKDKALSLDAEPEIF